MDSLTNLSCLSFRDQIFPVLKTAEFALNGFSQIVYDLMVHSTTPLREGSIKASLGRSPSVPASLPRYSHPDRDKLPSGTERTSAQWEEHEVHFIL